MRHLSHFLGGAENAEADEEDGVFCYDRFVCSFLYGGLLAVCREVLHDPLHSYLRMRGLTCLFSEANE